jgi:type 2A phosphatase activator TIP41
MHPQPSLLQAHGARPLQLLPVPVEESNENVVAGISIGGWNIGTSQGPIGDAVWMDRTLAELEPMSQHHPKDNPQQKPRQLVLPEMVFPMAYIALEYSATNSHSSILLSWTAVDFLKEWAVAHQDIPLPNPPRGANKDIATVQKETLPLEEMQNVSLSPPISASSRGVTIMETSDALLWKQKTTSNEQDGGGGGGGSGITSTTFHYDWTYSSPYSDTTKVKMEMETGDTGTGTGTVTGSSVWTPLPASGMPMHFLTDRSAPILYFDQLVLLEDDLHDNGQMQYTLKLRVMPTCIYILTQLFVRVDQVLLRVRETRVLVELEKTGGDANQLSSGPCRRPLKMYRDITWRECAW